MNTVTVLSHRRPALLRRTLDALARCHGFASWRVVICMDRPDSETRFLVAEGDPRWETVELDLGNALDEPYARVSRATLMALALGFATADFVAHLEEDCIPAEDYLEFMATQAQRYAADKRVFTVSGWWGSEPDIPEPALYATGLTPWFVPWGFGTWRDRFEEMRASWDFNHWDRHLNATLRGDRLTVHPYVSRVLDIGEHGGVNSSAEWAERQQRTQPAFAADVAAGMWAA